MNNKIKWLLVLQLCINATFVFAQTPSHMWTATGGSASNDAGLATGYDSQGNVYTAGYFSGTVDFDPSAGTSNLVSAGAYDIFLQKLDPFGNFLWAIRIGAAQNDVAFGLAVDNSGNCHLTGYFYGNVDFDPGVGTTTLNGGSFGAIYICKFSTTGSFTWASVVDGTSAVLEQAYAIAVDNTGNIYYTGHFRGPTDFDPGAGTLTLSTILGGQETFVSKLDANGTFLWAKEFTCLTTDAASGLGICADANGVTITGHFSATVDFDPGAGTINRTASGSDDIFVARLNTNGDYVWVATAGSSTSDKGSSVTKDAAGNFYVTGWFGGTVDFDPGAGTTSLVASGIDAFVWKLTSAGALSWIKQLGGTGTDNGNGIAVDGSSNVFCTGYFMSTADLNPGAATNNFTSLGAEDIFVTKLDVSGNYVWAGAVGGTGTEMGAGIAAGTSNNIYYTGQYGSTADFNPGSGVTSKTNAGGRDLFTSRWNQCTVAPSTPSIITGSTPVCVASTPTYSVTAASGCTYNWTLPVGWTGTSTSNSITPTVGASGGTISVSASNGCGTSSTSTFAVTTAVMPTTPSAISGPLSVCSSVVASYSVTLVSGVTYTWTKPVGWTGNSVTNQINTIPNSTGGTVSVVATNVCGTSASSSITVTSGTIPATPGPITGPTSICANTTNTYSVPTTAGVTYNWTLPGTWTGSSTTNSINATSGVLGGQVLVTATNACGTSLGQAQLSVTSLPTTISIGSIVTQNPVCQGSTNTYSVALIPTAVYTWTLPNGWSGTSTTNSITAVAGSTGGTISVYATTACATSPTTTYNINVTPLPLTPSAIIGNDTVCANSSSNVYNVSNQASVTFTWTLPIGWTGSSSTSGIVASSGTNGGTISVIASNTCGTSTASSMTVTTTPPPAAPSSISGSTSVCANSSNSYSVISVPGLTYNWNLPNGWSGSSLTSTIIGLSNTSGGTITVTAQNSCGVSSPVSIVVTIGTSPQAPSSISGSDSLCANSSNTYSVPSVPGETYTWTLPFGWTGSSTTSTITATSGTSGGTIAVTATSSCGTSPAAFLPVSIISVPSAPTTISGDTNICENTTNTYNVAAVSNETYTWTLPLGWSGSSTTASISTTAGNAGGNLQVVANNACGSSTPTSINVGVETIPLAPAAIFGTNVFCEYSPFALSCSAVANAVTYTWTYPSGWTANASTTTLTGSVDNSGGLITVTATNQCGTSSAATLSVTVNPMPVTTITTTSGYLESDQSGASYQWLDCSNSMSSIAFATSQQFTPLVNGSYAVVVDLSGCIDTSACDSFLTAGIVDHTASLVQIYPNPAQDVINISSSVPVESIVICDLTGRVVLAAGSATQFNISTLVPAVYIVTIHTNNGIVTQRILKE